MLSIKNFSLSLADKALIEALNVNIKNGQVVSLMGPSGIGKSSLLNFLSGTLSSGLNAQGEVYLDQVAIHTKTPQERRVGLLQQTPLLFPHMSILENLSFAIPAKVKKCDRLELAYQALERVGIKDKANATPEQLSGGQQARVALQRTLLSEPGFLLLDEPFSKLDPALRREVRVFVLEEIRKANIPALLVTHDAEDAKAMQGPCIDLAAAH
ncbi:ATP-binding cassette domain-containing protein [Marinomonas pollencensis]|uniref:Putative thiamine transport system ATP-binding protein n=1 Tax=Marinomonas pollencensis TaxID=491954 RepID=A0A3E0DMN6_9GAMM|nr:ATP-binding cassette domain-containing protein [Marinomonas pollencensis]REG83335.1 putative thiamine transport system ATP-binding protein [Marinomonas pollencensis]